VSNPSRISCEITAEVTSGACASSFPHGTDVLLTVAGSNGWRDILIRDLAGDSTSCPSAFCTATYTIEESHTLAVSFNDQRPLITASPTGLDFQAVAGGAAPADLSLRISNSGGGTLEWAVSDDTEWLSLAPSNGSSAGEVDSVAVSVSTSGLTPDTYSAKITIADENASNTPQTVTVALTVTEPNPEISLSTESVTFTGVEGGIYPPTQTLLIYNGGGGTLEWTVSGDAAWLSLAPPSGSSTGEVDEVTLGANTSSLSTGTYTATATIGAAAATNTPQTAAVTLQVLAPPLLLDIVAALLGGEALREERVEYLDDLGNKNGRLDVGDFLAWLDHTNASASTSAPRMTSEQQR
jgi:hypothetical protein